jgi:hypothetical protein
VQKLDRTSSTGDEYQKSTGRIVIEGGQNLRQSAIMIPALLLTKCCFLCERVYFRAEECLAFFRANEFSHGSVIVFGKG